MDYSINKLVQQAESFLITRPMGGALASVGITYGFGFHACIGIICTIVYAAIIFEKPLPSFSNWISSHEG